jgi:hypothetical protein
MTYKFWFRFISSVSLCLIGLLALHFSGASASLPASQVKLPQPDLILGLTDQFSYTVQLPLVVRNWWPDAFPNCRFGIDGGIQSSDAVEPLHMGWFLDWGARLTPPHPNGAEFVQVVKFTTGFGGYTVEPPTSTLLSIIAANPGATWLLGNEPDSPLGKNSALLPATYARAYHDLYSFIKSADPTAKISAGGIVQPTPLRFEYLNQILTAYSQQYHQSLPADLWNVHSYILREIDPTDPLVENNGYEVWGAYIPPGLTEKHGELYNYSDMYNLSIFRQRLIDFRSWMNDHGYRGLPLYITEFGTLFPYPPYLQEPPYDLPWVDENGVAMDEARTTAFLSQTFNLLLTLTDSHLGDPLDGNRVVQRWAWYSLNDTVYYGGPLFDPSTKARRPPGDMFASIAQAQPISIDLYAYQAHGDPMFAAFMTQTVTATLNVMFANSGNYNVSQPINVTFWDGPPGTGSIIGTQVFTNGISGCGGTAMASVTWPNLTAGLHQFYAQVDSDHTFGESNESNNLAIGQVLIGTYRIFLPITLHS